MSVILPVVSASVHLACMSLYTQQKVCHLRPGLVL